MTTELATKPKFVPQKLIKRPRVEIEIEATVQVSQGHIYFPILSLIKVECDTYMIVHDNGKLPLGSVLSGREQGRTYNYSYLRVEKAPYEALLRSLNLYDAAYQKSHLTSYSFITGAMAAQGYDFQSVMERMENI